jgi:hypothetical protein
MNESESGCAPEVRVVPGPIIGGRQSFSLETDATNIQSKDERLMAFVKTYGKRGIAELTAVSGWLFGWDAAMDFVSGNRDD